MNRNKNMLMAIFLAGGLLAVSVAGIASAARSSQAGPLPAGRAGMIGYVASVEGVTPAELRQGLKAGKTLLQIARRHNTSADDLATALLARVKTRLDAAVANHRLTSDQETALYNRMHARVAQLVVTPHPFQHLRSGRVLGAGPHTGRAGLLQTMATTCNTTPDALRAAFRAGGKTPLAICQATNASVTQNSLVSALVSAIKTRLDKAGQTMGLTSQQESSILARAQNRLNAWVTTSIPAGGRQHA